MPMVRSGWRAYDRDEAAGRASREPIAMGEEKAMSIISWLIVGLIAGWVGSKIVNKSGEGFFLDIVLGIVGALVGGFLFSLFGAEGVSGLNLYSMFVAIVGSVVVLVIYHTIFGRSTS
jgi:uncharacterized membrane protein YeaQ/YmgE (transglycosylase-associated protein family)